MEPDGTSIQMQPLAQAVLQIQRRLDREEADRARVEHVRKESLSRLQNRLADEMEHEREEFIKNKLAAERSDINRQLDLETAADQARRMGKRNRRPHQPLRIPTSIASPVARNSSWIDQIESADSTPLTPRRRQL